MEKLTDKLIKTLPAGTYSDGGAGLRGATLVLQISPKGKRSWDMFYRGADGKRARIGTKTFADCTSVVEARKTANATWKTLCAGGDPAAQRRQERESGSVLDIAEAYCESLLEAGQNSDSVQKYVASIRGMLVDEPLAKTPAARVRPADVESFLARRLEKARRKPQFRGGAATLERCRSQLVTVFRYAGITPNPAIAPKSLHNTKATRVAKASRRQEKTIPLDVLAERCRLLWAESEAGPYSQDARDLLRLLLFFSNRKSELLWMTWEQIDWARRVWIIPGTQIGNKSGVEDVKPLTEATLAVLRRRHSAVAGEEGDGAAGLVFPSASMRRDGLPYSESYLNRVVSKSKDKTAVCQRHGFHMTVHDIRRLAASWCKTYPQHIWAVPFVLNHAAKDGDANDSLYALGDTTEALRQTMQAFENWVIEQAAEQAAKEAHASNVVRLPA